MDKERMIIEQIRVLLDLAGSSSVACEEVGIRSKKLDPFRSNKTVIDRISPIAVACCKLFRGIHVGFSVVLSTVHR